MGEIMTLYQKPQQQDTKLTPLYFTCSRHHSKPQTSSGAFRYDSTLPT